MSDQEQPGAIATKEALLKSGWRGAIENLDSRECWHYSPVFHKLAEALATEGRYDEAKAVSLLDCACSLALRPDDDDGPLVPMWRDGSMRSTVLSDFKDADLDFFADSLSVVDDPELKGRLADILWLIRRDHQAAKIALETYLEACELLASRGDLIASDGRLRRTLDLAAELGRRGEPFEHAVRRFQKVVEDLAASGQRRPCLGILKALAHHGQAGHLASRMIEWAGDAVIAKDWFWAQHWWYLAREFASIARDANIQKEAVLGSARAFELQGDEAAGKIPPDPAVAAHWLQSAIGVLQRTGGTKTQRDRLMARALELQRAALGQMSSHSVKIDLTEPVKQAQEFVSKPTFPESAIALALLGAPEHRQALEERTREEIRDFPMQNLFASAEFDATGRMVAQRAPLPLRNEESAEAAFLARVFANARWDQRIRANVIDAARYRIWEKHCISLDELLALTHQSPFVPPGRERSMARGLYAGFRGDFTAAVLFLLPQLEHAIRFMLNRAGYVTIAPDQNGVQKERNLKQLLLMPELTQLVPEDTVFDLRGLLVEESGTNLRNLVAHGLVGDAQLDSPPTAYFWWSMLRLCVLPLVNIREENDDPKEDNPKEDQEDRRDTD
jgi:hypothetical protein